MFHLIRLYTVYEKPEASDPADRLVLLSEGFSWLAFFFNLLWLLYQRLWMPALVFLALSIVGFLAVEANLLSAVGNGWYQFWLQLMLGFHAYDIKGWQMKRRGYRMAGLLAARSCSAAEQRYYECAA